MDQNGGVDPADQWVFDPETGGYRLRLDGAGAATQAPQAAAYGPSPYSDPVPRYAGSDAAESPAPARPPRGRRKRPRRRLPVWAGGTIALVLVGGGIGGYMAYGHSTPACAAASPGTTGPDASPTPSPTASPATSEADSELPKGRMAAPVEVRVNVFDGTGRFGTSQSVLSWLQNANGVTRSTNAGPAPAPVADTTLDYAPNQADQARRLAAMMDLPASALKEGTKDAAFRAPMTLTLGRDFTAPGRPLGAPTQAPAQARPSSASGPGHCGTG